LQSEIRIFNCSRISLLVPISYKFLKITKSSSNGILSAKSWKNRKKTKKGAKKIM
jgi:hypothetical protein